jgi:alginate O-acetyltransferase complex protein AlgJ
MADFDLQAYREKQARDQVGVTRISRATAWFIAMAFVLLIGLVPLSQKVGDLRAFVEGDRPTWVPRVFDLMAAVPGAWNDFQNAEGPWFARVLVANRALLREMDRFEDDLEDASALGQRVRPWMQTALARLGAGNEQALVGRDGWLFFRPGLEYLTGPGFLEPRQLARRAVAAESWLPAPQPDPRVAIIDFHRQLASRDIQLVLMPTPVKATIHPEQFSAGLDPMEPLDNASFPSFIDDLQAAGVLVFDPIPVLMEAKAESGAAQYLATDTHWRPQSMERVAAALAAFLQERGLESRARPVGYETVDERVTNVGDITRMLDLPDGQRVFPEESAVVRQVRDRRGDLWRADPNADVLLLGDSFSNIFSLEAMGWGEAAGLAEHLSVALQRPVDRIARNDQAAFATREALARELARGRDRLDGKRVVIYQFASRELAVGDWKVIDLALGEPLPARFLVPESDQALTVTGVVAAVSPVPRPGTVPYADQVMSLHVVELESDGVPLEDPQAVVYTWGMRENVWTPAARLRIGDEVTLKLRSWAVVADDYEGINRSELDDFELQLVEPVWGEWGL